MSEVMNVRVMNVGQSKNYAEKGSCDNCIQEWVRAEAGPGTECAFDCVDKHNTEVDVNKCTVESNGGPCYKCYKDCQASGTAGRSLAGTVVVISLFFALMW